jgi:hypothetical protein
LRALVAFAVSTILSLPLAAEQTHTTLEIRDLQSHPFAAMCPSGSRLRLHLLSGDFRIVGHGDDKISVRLNGRNATNAQDLAVRFRLSGSDADIRIWGGPKDELQVIVEVPVSSMLHVRMPAGDLSIEGVSGDKDVELHAGDLTIAVGDAADYGHVDASVLTGDLEAPPFHESHGGLFRSFEKHGSGKYALHAHVGAGDLTLR